MAPYETLSAVRHVDTESGCEYHYVSSNTERFDLHDHDYYEIFLTVQGKITHIINDRLQPLQEGSLVFIRPQDIHTFSDDKSTLFRLVNLTLSRDTVDDLFAYLGEGFPAAALLNAKYPPSVILSSKQKDFLLKQLMECNAVNWQEKQRLKLYTRALLAEIFTKYFTDLPLHEESGIPLWLEELCEEMRRPENFIAGLGRMVSLSGKTREHLARNMKRYYSTTTTEFINNLRLNYAANMLLHSSVSILDLCYECGFQSPSRFYSAFRAQFGVSPRRYRTSHALRG